ncbi:uncharacterized protein [Anabrus simplex]|uniref:uncharacterized protein n=1 Tax=Anabrus simplex TaxID=316456 RepID=UPI0035A271C6
MTSKVGEVIQSANELAVFSMRDFLNTQVSEINSKPELKIPLSELVRMSLLLVILPLMLAVSLASADHCASSVGSKLDVSVQGRKNASEHWMITTVSEWSAANGLQVNPTKSQVILLAYQHQMASINKLPLPRVILQNVAIPFVPQVKNLSVIMDERMIWSGHILHICQEVDTRRLTSTENQWELAVNVHQERRSCDSSEVEQLVSVTTVHRPVHGTSSNTTAVTTTPATTTPAIDTTSKPTTTTPTTTTTTTTKPKSCPHSGYQLFEGFNCYKTYSEEKSWSDAREQCKRDGGDLMVLESERERNEVFPTMLPSVGYWNPWMGVYKPEGEDRWVSVKDAKALLCSFVLQQL